jgi:cytochrome c oxidase assembly protein subunit 15
MSGHLTAGAPSSALGRGFLALAVVTYGLLVFGASVRVHGAGLSCPDWPLCFGEVIPQLDFHIFLEWGHRVLASLVSLGFLVLGGLAMRSREARARVAGLLGVAAVVLGVQVVLGGLTVLHLLAYWSVTLHLLTGNLFCALIFVIGLRLRDHGVSSGAVVPPSLRWWTGGLLASVVLQMALGGLVSSNYAGLACTEWPTCNGGVWFPVFDGIVGLQVFHRLGAYTVAAFSLAFLAASWRVAELRPAAGTVFSLVLVQIALGVANVLLAMPVELAIAHGAVADLIVLSVTWATWRVFKLPVRLAAGPLPSAAGGHG